METLAGNPGEKLKAPGRSKFSYSNSSACTDVAIGCNNNYWRARAPYVHDLRQRIFLNYILYKCFEYERTREEWHYTRVEPNMFSNVLDRSIGRWRKEDA